MTVSGDNVTDVSATTSLRPFVTTSQPPSSESTSSQSDRTRRLSVHQDVTTASVLRQSTVVSQTSTIVSDLITNYSMSALLLNETVTVTSLLTTTSTAADTTTGLWSTSRLSLLIHTSNIPEVMEFDSLNF